MSLEFPSSKDGGNRAFIFWGKGIHNVDMQGDAKLLWMDGYAVWSNTIALNSRAGSREQVASSCPQFLRVLISIGEFIVCNAGGLFAIVRSICFRGCHRDKTPRLLGATQMQKVTAATGEQIEGDWVNCAAVHYHSTIHSIWSYSFFCHYQILDSLPCPLVY